MDFNWKNSYKPLPEGTALQNSSIHGLGVFTTREWRKKEVVGVTHIQTRDIRFQDGLIRTPFGGFINHSDSPNCVLFEEDGVWSAMLVGDVGLGEEITLDYGQEKCGEGYRNQFALQDSISERTECDTHICTTEAIERQSGGGMDTEATDGGVSFLLPVRV